MPEKSLIDPHQPDLTVQGDVALGWSAHVEAAWPLPGVRAGSALVQVRGKLLAVQDDAFAVAWIEPASRKIDLQALKGAGEALPKPLKPDFEAAVVAPGGHVYVLGSGSTPQRHHIARIDPVGRVTLADCGALYAAIAQTIGTTPNLEGAIALANGVRLFHRGSGGAPSIGIDVPWTALDGEKPLIQRVQRYAIGNFGGVPLAITDAATDDEGRIHFLAVAEDTPNAYDDGPIVGMVVGVIDNNALSWTPLIEADGKPSVRKAEGLALDADGRHAWVITDPDDPQKDAALCRVRLDGFR